MLGSTYIGANRASRRAGDCMLGLACFVPPALGLSERELWYDKLGSTYIGANRASRRAGDCMLGLLALFRRPLDFLRLGRRCVTCLVLGHIVF